LKQTKKETEKGIGEGEKGRGKVNRRGGEGKVNRGGE